MFEKGTDKLSYRKEIPYTGNDRYDLILYFGIFFVIKYSFSFSVTNIKNACGNAY